jgi:hypothetical protein
MTKKLLPVSFLVGMLLAALFVSAQSGDYDKDLQKFLSINGSTETYTVVYDQLTTQMKAMKPNVPDSAWAILKTEVFDPAVNELVVQMMPLYKKHFTDEDLKELITFYESPAGKKLVAETPLLTKETMQISQSWGMNLMSKFYDWLAKKGYNN